MLHARDARERHTRASSDIRRLRARFLALCWKYVQRKTPDDVLRIYVRMVEIGLYAKSATHNQKGGCFQVVRTWWRLDGHHSAADWRLWFPWTAKHGYSWIFQSWHKTKKQAA